VLRELSKLSEAKMLGGIGALIYIIGVFIPAIGPIVSIIGFILVFIAVRYIANETKDEEIFKNYLIHFIFNIIAVVTVFALFTIAFFSAGGFSFITMMQGQNITDFNSFMATFGAFLYACIASLVIGWILFILSTIYLRKSYNSIAKKTGVDLFATTGLLYFIGAITLIIVIGGIIILIAKILEIIAYFTLPDELPKSAEAEAST
jgi:uncharacterized membrane protein